MPQSICFPNARANYRHKALSYLAADLYKMAIEDKFDGITCFEFIEHVSHQNEALQILREKLSDEGILLISTPRGLDKKRSSFHTTEFSFEEFKEFLYQQFEYCYGYFQNNYFSSLISDKERNCIVSIHSVTENYHLSVLVDQEGDFLLS